MGWIVGIGIVILLAWLPLGILFRYDETGTSLKIAIGFWKISVLPRKKQQKTGNKKKQKTEAEKIPSTQEKTETVGGSLTDFLPLVDLTLDFLRDVRHRLRVRCMELKIMLAGEDPAKLAIHYGNAWAALGNLIPGLERAFVIQHRDIAVMCDFAGDATTVYACLEVTMTLGRLICLSVSYGVRAVTKYMKIQKKRKDVS